MGCRPGDGDRLQPLPAGLPKVVRLSDGPPKVATPLLAQCRTDVTRCGHAHRYEFFSSGRMQRNGCVEIGLGSLHLYCNRNRLDDLSSGIAHDMAADHPVGGAVDENLHQRLGVAMRHSCFDWPEGCLVDVDMAKPIAGFRLRQSDGADLWLRENSRRDSGMV